MLLEPVIAAALLTFLAPGGEDYRRAVADVDEANIAVNRDPEANYPQLAEALEHLAQYEAELGEDVDTRELLVLSMLNLARAQLLAGDAAAAAETMDEVLRATPGQSLPLERFGPTLAEFHDERRAELDRLGTAEIQVECEVSCQLLVDEQPMAEESGPLYLGTYRVWIRATDGSVPAERHEIELDHAGGVEVVRFPAAGLPPVEKDEPAVRQRILPRWAELGVAIFGVGAVVGGGVALAFDGRCTNGGDPSDPVGCPSLFESTGAGLTAIGLGGVLALTGGVMLVVDEVRVGRNRGQQLSLAWTIRF